MSNSTTITAAEVKLAHVNSTHTDAPEFDASLFGQAFKQLTDMSQDCVSDATQRQAARVCTETRNTWGDVWRVWLRQHDEIRESLRDFVPSFEAAQRAAQAFVDRTKDTDVQVKEYGLHLLKNISWRLEMARVLMDTTRPQFEREKEVNGMLDRVAGRQ
jgi:hypothetical protein